ncbi:MAG: hypothetical protein HGA24_03275, partial [Candidatus Aminicenantes bacterium]|nr:hypothetical protein [Candidatus Aminicenantes bacterium]
MFVCYAPAENPQIAVAVVIERGVWGSYTAPVARDILDAYFGLNKAESSGEKVFQEGAVFIELAEDAGLVGDVDCRWLQRPARLAMANSPPRGERA